jgi:putative colanic acid biosynthesis UDP-glucose lipid carrier transferase
MQVLGSVDDLSRVLEHTRVDEIIVAWPLSRMHEIDYVIQTADQQGVRVSLMPSLSGDIDFSIGVQNVDSLPILEVRNIALDKFANAFFKRVFDILFATAVLVLLSPVFVLIAILVRLSSPGPVFYKPYRNGQDGNKFICYKFRTMKSCDDEKSGGRSTVKNDPRITLIGRFLRKYDLDELPQFYNVIMGNMSVVGPRPHRVFLNDTLKNVVERYMIRHYVKPGITGWAQVNGWRGPTETNEQRIQRIRHDLWYIKNWSIWLDVRIIFLTVFGKKTRKNAF